MATPSPSPTIALANASLQFVRKEQRRKESERGPIDRAIQHAVALVETTATFAANCHADVDAEAQAKLGVFFEVTVGELIDKDKMGWIDDWERREFVLSCAEYLAHAAFELAERAKAPVSAAILEEAARQMIEAKEPNCQLPQGQQGEVTVSGPTVKKFRMLGSACLRLAKEIGTELETKR